MDQKKKSIDNDDINFDLICSMDNNFFFVIIVLINLFIICCWLMLFVFNDHHNHHLLCGHLCHDRHGLHLFHLCRHGTSSQCLS